MSKKQVKNPPPRALVVADPAHVRLLASNVRDAILQTVVNQRQASIREIGEQIGARPASLYRHIDALVAAGLIRKSGTRKTTKRDATLYEAEGDVIHLRRDLADPVSVAALQRVVEARARHAGRGTARAMGSVSAVTRGAGQDTKMLDLIGWLDPDQLALLNAHLDSIAELFRGAARREDTKLLAITAMLRPQTPVEQIDEA